MNESSEIRGSGVTFRHQDSMMRIGVSRSDTRIVHEDRVPRSGTRIVYEDRSVTFRHRIEYGSGATFRYQDSI